MTTPAPSPAPGTNRLVKQWRWMLVAIAIVALAVISGQGGPQLRDGSGSSNGSDGDTGRCTVRVTADMLNVRAGPGTQHPTVGKLSRGTVADAQKETSGGFRKLAEDRWVANEFVRPSSGCN